MLAKRIIPCLDVRDGRVVKGVNFVDIKDVGDPVEIARYYNRQGADEITFLDITATHEGRGTMIDVVERTASEIFMPLTVGGGISTVEDFRDLLLAGADKISINSAAVRDKTLIARAADRYGSQCVVVAIDIKKNAEGRYTVVINGGRIDTGIDAIEWALECEKLGAGEILLTSMETDGVGDGYDLTITDTISKLLHIPVIASGGCGKLEHFAELFQKTSADAALVASIFHYHILTIPQVKKYFCDMGIPTRRLP